jgi:Protein of unknown function (DUF3047)
MMWGAKATRLPLALLTLFALHAKGAAQALPTAAPVLAASISAFNRAESTLGKLPSRWQLIGLPNKPALALTRFELLSGPEHSLRITTNNSYGALVYTLDAEQKQRSIKTLSWRWRIDSFAEGVNLRTRDGDDSAVKVCILFDMPIERVPFSERLLLRLANTLSNTPLPNATLCYVWDANLAAGTLQDNPYTRRVRSIVVHSLPAGSGWQTAQRTLAADFARTFGKESPELPPILAIAIGGDSDNTGGSSVAYLADLNAQ